MRRLLASHQLCASTELKTRPTSFCLKFVLSLFQILLQLYKMTLYWRQTDQSGRFAMARNRIRLAWDVRTGRDGASLQYIKPAMLQRCATHRRLQTNRQTCRQFKVEMEGWDTRKCTGYERYTFWKRTVKNVQILVFESSEAKNLVNLFSSCFKTSSLIFSFSKYLVENVCHPRGSNLGQASRGCAS